MPLVRPSSCRPPFLLRSGLLQTLFPALFRSFSTDLYQRERIETPDDDFLDLDWAITGSSKLAILSHGLEGNSCRHYMIGMARMLNRSGWDALAWNYRSCSGEPNRQLRMYHNGSIEDLDVVVRHALSTGRYETLALIGFSLGGNLTLVYLGSKGAGLDARIRRAVVFSVPCALHASAREIARPMNRIYLRNFLSSLHKKIKAKQHRFPDTPNDRDYHPFTASSSSHRLYASESSFSSASSLALYSETLFPLPR